MKDGIININKPADWTSQDVCAKLRHRLHIKKIGHTGTLDPMATGVLPVCIGKATRIIEYYDGDRKTYHAGMKLGITTDTLDITGEVLSAVHVQIVTDNDIRAKNQEQTASGLTADAIEYGKDAIVHYKTASGVQESPLSICETDIRRAFADYTGVIAQIPPKYSALKINGKRAYELAREGREFEIKSREITIFANEITRIDAESGEIEFDVTCSKGTYIRTICDDIGRTLGCGAVMTSLVRTASGYFDITESHDLAEIIEMSDEDIEKCIIPMEETLINLGIIELNDNRVTAFINGNSSGTGYKVLKQSQLGGFFRVYNNGTFLGTASFSGRELIPAKVISH